MTTSHLLASITAQTLHKKMVCYVSPTKYDRPSYLFENGDIVHTYYDLKGYDSILSKSILESVVELTLPDINTDIIKIKISYVNFARAVIHGCQRINCCLTFVNKSNGKHHYLLKDNAAEEILEKLNQIANHLPA